LILRAECTFAHIVFPPKPDRIGTFAAMAERRVLHLKANATGSLRLVFTIVQEMVIQLPRLWKLRRIYRRRPRPAEPVVVLMGDNMDATHGISVSSRRLVRDLRARGKSVYMVGISHSLHAPGARTEDGAVWMTRARVVQDLFGYPGQELAMPSLREIFELLARRPVDLIEIETPGIFGFVAILVGPVLGITIVQNYRTDLVSYYRMLLQNPLFIGFLEWYTRNFLNCGDRVVVPSRAFRQDVIDFGLPHSKVVQLPRGVELSRFHPDLADRAAWKAYGDLEGPIVLFLGRVSKEKGLEVLIEAWPEIQRRHPDAILGVVGDGPFRAEFEARMKPIGRALFAGMVVGDELPKLVGSCSVLAFPSTTDTFGNAVLEALASGVPAVVTDQGGPCEIVEDGSSGLVIGGNDARLLAEAVDRVLSQEDLRTRLARNARLRAEEYSPERATERQWEFFQELHDRRGAR
jgi:glycosyltransferase involved in cell wall biosynthesis